MLVSHNISFTTIYSYPQKDNRTWNIGGGFLLLLFLFPFFFAKDNPEAEYEPCRNGDNDRQDEGCDREGKHGLFLILLKKKETYACRHSEADKDDKHERRYGERYHTHSLLQIAERVKISVLRRNRHDHIGAAYL